ncbi:peptidylprolyl isomerase [Truepera radiovictrix]|uniref:Peptidyl-prolyl cis-trans isomerase n=1 Tax=Truepera radiovictrix (strain DSM 17093 / CIP 108686 / LMG 22925 / RQ-24) TaxID=649638 RepID=D7CRF4_TRURR|nr:peptidylprolyl isomerase [Truepera radiovictrix]ADI15242.1 Peptidylprolyl isomerase [Truepera radiovictrix DSM 17093]WMT56206.1 peptidylprolyl isomerase [Truepera radiovictrix]
MARPFRLLILSLAAWPAALAAAPEVNLPEGYTPTPLLSEEPVREFSGADEVLAPNTDYGAVMVTSQGTLILDLYEDLAPRTVNNFVFLARHRFYDGVVFHRVLEDFMAQTGDPTGTGTGGPGYTFDDEFAEGLQHDRPGLLSMANAGPDTNGSQFFITFTETPWLDGAHAIFGEVTEGFEVLDALQRIDPSQPSAIVAPAASLAELSQQGVTLAGDADTTVEAYLAGQLGGLPARGERFEVDGFSGVVGQGGGGETLVGFFPEPDVIESLIIIERPRE